MEMVTGTEVAAVFSVFLDRSSSLYKSASHVDFGCPDLEAMLIKFTCFEPFALE
jgi:hypothetical protein